MPALFAPDSADAIPLMIVTPETLPGALEDIPAVAAAWAQAQDFKAGIGTGVLLPNAAGRPAMALLGRGDPKDSGRSRFAVGAAGARLPTGSYRIIGGGLAMADLEEIALGWLLESYRFDRYKEQSPASARLVAPEEIDVARLEALVSGETLTRDLINTPASDMGPADLEAAARSLASGHQARIAVIEGDALLEQNFPMIHAVGRAAAPHRAPRLIDMTWGESGPRITLVGKGVCFDTGGLDIKPASSMGLMKKDMGGAATVLGLASAIMDLGMGVRLRVLIPAVENAISGDAFRPQDILTSRKGLTVEINNTDAEGRLVLADALALASEEDPHLIVSMATLTGAARVAVGPDIAPYFTDDEAMAAAIADGGLRMSDPVWRLPFHQPYEAMIEPALADLDNAPSGGMAGAITAALFLRRFVEGRYVHFDIYGWQPVAAPGRPKGGVGQGARALLAALPKALGL